MGDAMHGTVAYTTLPASSPLPLPLAYLPPPLHRPPSPADDPGFQNRISPSILLIILILAAIFFLSGLLHLLVRFLLRPAARGSDDAGADATALQGQLQQLFHLHDAGVDQSFIDALPVFLYRSILGGGAAKAAASAAADPFDCAVCLCEFAADDRLRLLPKCSHAFHVECIDTWLLSHSTCPLCRRSLLADFSPCGGGGGGRSPLVYVLESGSDSSPEFAASQRLEAASSALHFGHLVEDEEAVAQVQKQEEFTAKEEVVVPVKLGKFRSTAEVSGNQTVEGGGCSANPCLDQRRCFSMGSYEYVLDESSLLQVAVKPPAKKRPAVRKPGHRIAMSDCDCHSKREGFHGFDAPKTFDCGVAHPNDGCSKQPRIDKKESFSVSKIWMRGAKKAGTSGSRRVSSFRLSLQRTASDVAKRRVDVSPVTESEYNVSAWDKSEKSVGGSTVDWDVEAATAGGGGCGSGNELRLRADEAPSFARRTWLWIRGHL